MSQFNCILCDRTATTEVCGYPSCHEDAEEIHRMTETHESDDPGPTLILVAAFLVLLGLLAWCLS